MLGLVFVASCPQEILCKPQWSGKASLRPCRADSVPHSPFCLWAAGSQPHALIPRYPSLALKLSSSWCTLARKSSHSSLLRGQTAKPALKTELWLWPGSALAPQDLRHKTACSQDKPHKPGIWVMGSLSVQAEQASLCPCIHGGNTLQFHSLQPNSKKANILSKIKPQIWSPSPNFGEGQLQTYRVGHGQT